MCNATMMVMDKYKAYRERVKQDPEKVALQRQQTRERVALHRKKKRECKATEVALQEENFPEGWSEKDIREFMEERLAIREHGGG